MNLVDSERINRLLNDYPIYWNNYYIWDAQHPPKIIVYRNDVNMKILTEYTTLLSKSLQANIEYTNYFIDYLSSYS
jgi:hypothetical protein